MTEEERMQDAVTVAHAWVAAVNAADADGLGRYPSRRAIHHYYM